MRTNQSGPSSRCGAPARPGRRGMTIFEVAVSAVVLGAVVTTAAQLVQWSVKLHQVALQKRCALEAATSLLDRLSAHPWSAITAESAKDASLAGGGEGIPGRSASHCGRDRGRGGRVPSRQKDCGRDRLGRTCRETHTASAADDLGLPIGKRQMTKRSGFTLIELLVVLSLLAVILPMAGGTVFFLLRAQSQSAEALRDGMAITQFSHIFRTDVHAARSARTSAPSAADRGVVLVLDGSRVIEYRTEPAEFVTRIVRRGETVERRERFRVGPVHPKFAIAREGDREIAVTISPRCARIRFCGPIDDTNSREFASRPSSGGTRKSVHFPQTTHVAPFRPTQPTDAHQNGVAAEGSEKVMNATSFQHRRAFDDASVRAWAYATVNSTSPGNCRVDCARLPLVGHGHRHALASGRSERATLPRPARLAGARRVAGRSRIQPGRRSTREVRALLWRDLGHSRSLLWPNAKRDREDQRAEQRGENPSRRHVEVTATFAESNEPAITASRDVEAR